MASGKRKKGKKNGLFAKLLAAVIIIAVGVFAADYFNIFTFEEWKEFFVIEKESVAEGEVQVHYINVMGTVNICEAVRLNPCVKSFLNVTTDKVYKNNEWEWGYRENEPLDGYDPYSNSKSCSELVTHSYINSFYGEMEVAVSTARAGNVIGGGDFANDRIIPDCVRAAEKREDIIVRNPHSTRPYQHVLEPLKIYLMILKAQYEDKELAGFYNVGPGK